MVIVDAGRRRIVRDRVKRQVIDMRQRVGRLQPPMSHLLGGARRPALVTVNAETRQIVRDRLKRQVVDMALKVGRLETPMSQLLGTLHDYQMLPRNMIGLELFGMHGLGHTRDYVDHCTSLEFYEINPTYAAYAARTLPNTNVVVADSIQTVKSGRLKRDKYTWIVLDNPFTSPFGAGYTEHFDLLPELFAYIDQGALVLDFILEGFPFSVEHARRREEFYGKPTPSIDEAVAVYQASLSSAGVQTSKCFYTSRDRCSGYLTFICRR